MITEVKKRLVRKQIRWLVFFSHAYLYGTLGIATTIGVFTLSLNQFVLTIDRLYYYVLSLIFYHIHL